MNKKAIEYEEDKQNETPKAEKNKPVYVTRNGSVSVSTFNRKKFGTYVNIQNGYKTETGWRNWNVAIDTTTIPALIEMLKEHYNKHAPTL